MGRFSVRIKHDQQLWTKHEKGGGLKRFTRDFPEYGSKIVFDDFGTTISVQIELSDDEQLELAQSLVGDKYPKSLSWQVLSPAAGMIARRAEEKLLLVARSADNAFRCIPKGVRLPAWKLEERSLPNSQQYFQVFHWRLSDDEITNIGQVFEGLEPPVKDRYIKNGLLVPFSAPFDQKQIHLSDDEANAVLDSIDLSTPVQPFRSMYGIAWETFAINRSPDAAILILATSLETALKWKLSQSGDEIAKYLLENVQSPPLKKLYQCAVQSKLFEHQDKFSTWLTQLSEARNFIAHKPKVLDLDFLQLGRWFAVCEAILNGISGSASDPLAGYVVKPIGTKASEHFVDGARGVVLRREVFTHNGENPLHVLMDTGETYYFGENSYEVASDKEQKFPSAV